MSSVIKLKRSSTGGAVPAAGDLEVGEVAINLADRVIYSKQSGGAVVRIGEAALGNTNASIAAQATRIGLVNTNLTGTNTALRTLISTNASDITTQTARIGLVNTNLTETNTALRALISTNATDISTNASDISTQTARINLVNTNLTETNTALRSLITSATGSGTQALDDVQQTNTAIRGLVSDEAARITLVNSNLTDTNTALRTLISTNASDITSEATRIGLVNTNLTGTNTALRTLISTNATDIATNASDISDEAARITLVNTNLTNTNTAIRGVISNVDDYHKAALANTNSAIDGLSTSLSGSYLTVADPASTGHFNHTGRASISTNLQVAGNTTISGNLTVEGDVTYISTTNIEVNDPLMKLAANNTISDVVDTGFFALYDNSGTTNYAGLFRDATDGVFKLFKDSEAAPTTTVDVSATGYALAQLDAIVDGGSF
jgi:uncharacterized protein YbcI